LKEKGLNEIRLIKESIPTLRTNLLDLGFNLEKKDSFNDVVMSISGVLNSLESMSSLFLMYDDIQLEIDKFFTFEEASKFRDAVKVIVESIDDSLNTTQKWIGDLSVGDKELTREFENRVQATNIFSISKNPIPFNVIYTRQFENLSIVNVLDPLNEIKHVYRFFAINPRSVREITLKSLRDTKSKTDALQAKIQESAFETTKNVKKISAIKSEIDTIKTESEKAFELINVRESLISKIVGDSEVKKNSIDTRLEQTQDIHKAIVVIRDEINKLLEDSRLDRKHIADEILTATTAVEKVERASLTANSAEEELKRIQNQANDILQKANEVLTTAGSVVLGVNYDNQYQEAKKNILFWPAVASIAIMISIGFCFYATVGSENGAYTSEIIARLAIAPISLIAAFFAAGQYIKQKQIVEDYAYKKTLALSVISFKKELRETDDGHEREYMISVLKDLQKSPLDSLERKSFRRELKIVDKMRAHFLKEISKNLAAKNTDDKNKNETPVG